MLNANRLAELLTERYGVNVTAPDGTVKEIVLGNPTSATKKAQAAHVIDLEETTKSVGQKYFSSITTLSQGITLGLGHLMSAKKVILLANGIGKSEVIKQTIRGAVSEALPASILQKHKNSFIFLDKEAAALL